MGHRRGRRCLFFWALGTSLVVACAAPAGPARDAADGTSTSTATPTPAGSSRTAAGTSEAAAATESTTGDTGGGVGASGGGGETGGSGGRGTDGSDGGTGGGGQSTAGSGGQTTGGSGQTTGGGTGGQTTGGSGQTTGGSSGQTTGSGGTGGKRGPTGTGRTTVPAPINIPQFNQIQGESWTTYEARVLARMDEICGRHGPRCVKVTTSVRTDPSILSEQDCPIRDYEPKAGLKTGGTIVFVINDPCDGRATGTVQLTAPKFAGLERRSWEDPAVQQEIYDAIATACGALPTDCVDHTTSVEPDPAWARADDPDCAVRTARLPDQLWSTDLPDTPQDDDLIVFVLNDACE